MKKTCAVLILLSGLLGLTGCGSSDSDTTTEPLPDCSTFAGSYSGTITFPINSTGTSITSSAEINIQANCGMTGTAIEGNTNGQGFANTPTTKNFNYNMNWGNDSDEGTCNYTSTSINCSGQINGVPTQYALNRN